MSMHKIPLTPLEEEGLRLHGLPIGTPSQRSDTFRQGVAWGIGEAKRLTEENERLRENAKIIYELEQLAARSNNELLVENERLRKDAERLDWIANEYAHIEPFGIPTGEGDSETGWKVSQEQCGQIKPKQLSVVYKDSLREAIDAARGAK